jgi:ATP/maltotriose-dependent transcriptional regulator MalT/DNA-binding SARP family transcriptional activator
MSRTETRWLFDEIQSKIPAKKFYSPRIDAASLLFRPRLFDKCFKPRHQAANLILIESRAGNGKTTFVAQSLNHLQIPYIWYWIGLEDQDPMTFMAALYLSVQKKFPSFSVPLLEKVLEKGKGSQEDQQQFANVLLNNLDPISKQNSLYYVFDDIYKLKPFQESYQLFTYLVESAPPHLSFVLISRNRIFSSAQLNQTQRKVLRIRDDELSMTRMEIADFLNMSMHLPAPGAAINDLHNATEGWVMGISLFTQFLKQSKSELEWLTVSSLFAKLERSEIAKYFSNELVSALNEDTRLALFKAALLDDVPLNLARQLGDPADIEGLLRQFTKNNQFVRSLDDSDTLFSFHAVFHNYLMNRATQQFTKAQINDVYHAAAKFYTASGAYQEALNYYLKAGDYMAVENTLHDVGIELITTNRLNTLAAILHRIPSDTIAAYPWMTFFYGLVCMASAPHSALAHLEEARAGFIKQEDKRGEMLATGLIIHFHITIDALHNLARPLLARAETLFSVQKHELNIYFRANIAQIIAGGYCFLYFDMEKADRYAREALVLAEQNGLDDIQVTTRSIRGYQYLYQGKLNEMKAEMECAFELLNSPAVGDMSKRYLRFAHANQLAMAGDYHGYQYWKLQLSQLVADDFTGQSVLGPFMLIWDVNFAIAQGNLKKAAQLLGKGMASGFAAANPHIRSLFLHFRAYIHALNGLKTDAIADAQVSLQLRNVAGGKRFIIFNRVILGATYIQLNMQMQAQAVLSEAIDESVELKETALRCGADFQLARLHLANRNIDNAKKHIRNALSLMRENQYLLFYSWHHDSCRQMIAFAIHHSIEADYAQQLAAINLNSRFLTDGKEIPLLEVNTLGGTALKFKTEKVVESEAITPTQRSLLALLVSSPGQITSQAKIQLLLWPDEAPQKARSRIDNLISRFRKTLKGLVSPFDVKNYFIVEKGIVRMQHCRIDAIEFKKHIDRGLSLIKHGANWQACTEFFHALRRWNGKFMPETHLDGAPLDFSRDLVLKYIDISHHSAAILADINEIEEAIRIAENALSYDTINQPLVKLLYRCYVSAKDSVNAKRLLAQYQKELKALEISDTEVTQSLEACWKPDNLHS